RGVAARAQLTREHGRERGRPGDDDRPVVRRCPQLAHDRDDGLRPERAGRLHRLPRTPTPRAWIACRIPIASRFVISDEPPTETNGSGIPVTGAIPIVMPTLTNTWNRNATTIPPATIAEKRSRATAITFSP